MKSVKVLVAAAESNIRRILRKSVETCGHAVEIDEASDAESAHSYEERIESARKAIANKNIREAMRWVRSAFALDTSRAEAYNVLGIITEIEHDILQAQKYYRAAIALNPTYEPAHNNLHRTTRLGDRGPMDLGVSSRK